MAATNGMDAATLRELTLANVRIMLAGEQHQLKYGYEAPEIIITHSEDEYGGLYAAVVSVLYSERGKNKIATLIDTRDYENLVDDVDALRKLYKVSQVELTFVHKSCFKSKTEVFGSTPFFYASWAEEVLQWRH